MLLKGLQKLTLLDFPGKVACTVFTGGCNFRCPFCHNASLVTHLTDEVIDENEFFSFLKKREGILEGVCVSGGEPTLQPDLYNFIKRIKELGFAVKLDTNGYRPDVIRMLCNDGLLDYVAMDIKNSPEKYSLTTAVENLDFTKIRESAEFLMNGNIDFEFRTTVVSELHKHEDFEAIGKWLKGDEPYFLQSFIDSGDTVEKGFNSPLENEMNDFLGTIVQYIPKAQIRG